MSRPAILLAVKPGTKFAGAYPISKLLIKREAKYTPLLMSTELTMGTIGSVFGLQLEVLLPACLEECRIIFYFGKVCPHFGQVASRTSSAADSLYFLNSTSAPNDEKVNPSQKKEKEHRKFKSKFS
jgi:hypothetical protein